MSRPDRPAATFFRSSVCHVRLRPHEHRFFYVVPFICVDIDRLDEAAATSAMFSVGRFNLISFYPEDHSDRHGLQLRGQIESYAKAAGIDAPISRIELVCMPRVLGSAFNPLSVFYCWTNFELVLIVYAVRNTFGERHSYVMRVRESEGRVVPHECDKLFFVSPFLDMAMRYRFLATTPGDTFNIKIIEHDEQGVVLTALLSASRVNPRPAALLALALRQMLGGLKVLGAIHFEALRLWVKGHRIRSRPSPPATGASFGEPGEYSKSDSNFSSARKSPHGT